MKNIIIKTITCALPFIMGSCVSMDEYPEDRLSPDTYFKTPVELEYYTNQFYGLMPQPGEFRWYEEEGELFVPTVLSEEVLGNRPIPGKASDVGWNWSMLRHINYYLQHSQNCTDEAARKKYDGVAYFFRAWFYYEKLTRFGEVPWYDEPLASDQTELLCKPRDSRDVIINHIIDDCDKAFELIPEGGDIYHVSRWAALALKSRATLFEGTFRKYHMGDPFNAQRLPYEDLLRTCADASRKLMDESGLSLFDNGSATPYRDLFTTLEGYPQEEIWVRRFGEVVGGANNANESSRGRGCAMTKRFMILYLNADGTRYTDDPGWKTNSFVDECKNRDPRMAQTVITPGYRKLGETKVSAPDIKNTGTGYQYCKYVMEKKYDAYMTSRCVLPIFRLAEVMLNYAEAFAEIEALTQDDLDMSVNLIRRRAGMPDLIMSDANARPDELLASEEWGYPNVDKGRNKGVILEIRRERLVELPMELVHYNDILRWKEGKTYEKPFYGIYFPGDGKYDLTGDGKPNVCLYTGKKPGGLGLVFLEIGKDIKLSEGDHGFAVEHGGAETARNWNENRDYLYGIPSIERQRSGGKLTRNRGRCSLCQQGRPDRKELCMERQLFGQEPRMLEEQHRRCRQRSYRS